MGRGVAVISGAGVGVGVGTGPGSSVIAGEEAGAKPMLPSSPRMTCPFSSSQRIVSAGAAQGSDAVKASRASIRARKRFMGTSCENMRCGSCALTAIIP